MYAEDSIGVPFLWSRIDVLFCFEWLRNPNPNPNEE